MKYVGFLALWLSVASAAAEIRPATEVEIEAIREGMELQLADAESARFNRVQVNEDGEMCGLVNAKNRMGAYVGYQAFTGMIFTIGDELKAAPMGVGSDAASRALCKEKGFSLPP